MSTTCALVLRHVHEGNVVEHNCTAWAGHNPPHHCDRHAQNHPEGCEWFTATRASIRRLASCACGRADEHGPHE